MKKAVLLKGMVIGAIPLLLLELGLFLVIRDGEKVQKQIAAVRFQISVCEEILARPFEPISEEEKGQLIAAGQLDTEIVKLVQCRKESYRERMQEIRVALENLKERLRWLEQSRLKRAVKAFYRELTE